MMQAQDFPLISHSPKRWVAFVRSRTPILESIIPLDSRARRNWEAVGNDTIITYAKWAIDDMGVGSRKDLERADAGLYAILRKRKLLDAVGLGNSNECNRSWVALDRDELVMYAEEFIAVKGIDGRNELENADSGLCRELRKRGLLDEVGLRIMHQKWIGMNRDELIGYTKRFIAERHICKRSELQKAHPPLYERLRARKLLDEIGLPNLNEGHRDWAGLNRDEMVRHAKAFIAEKAIESKDGLERADSGLYSKLKRKKLLEVTGLHDKHRDWEGMQHHALIAFAKRFISERGIVKRSGLAKADPGLYAVLIRKNLIGIVGLPDSRGKRRGWARMGRDEFVAHAKKFITDNEITERKKLENADRGLYQALRKRKLLDAVFSEIESSIHADAVAGVIDALDSFGDEK